MRLELTDRERLLLSELLETVHKERLHELHHTTTGGYKRILREQIEVIEGLRTRIEPTLVTRV